MEIEGGIRVGIIASSHVRYLMEEEEEKKEEEEEKKEEEKEEVEEEEEEGKSRANRPSEGTTSTVSWARP